MASAYIELWNDITNGILIVGPTATGWNGATFSLATLKIYQGSKLPFRWYPIKPSGLGQFEYVSLDGITLDIAIGPRAGAEDIKARQNAWTQSADGRYLEAVLNLNTTPLNNAIDTSDTYTTFFEIEMSLAGDGRPVYQEQITIISRVIGPTAGAALPAAAVEFLTKAQQDARYVKYSGNRNGATIDLPSPDGTHHRLMGCNNDGSAQDEIA